MPADAGALPPRRPGRPRLRSPVRPGPTGREQLLDAAAELFTTAGYARSSTRQLAEAAGLSQSAVYHWFPTKEDLLEALLADTVDPVLAVGRALAERGPGALAAPARLHALALWDGQHLCGGRWNLGMLYLLPELRLPRFARFQDSRADLMAVYAAATGAVTALTGLPEAPDVEDLPFRMVEALVDMRADGVDVSAAPHRVALACLRVTGWTGDPGAVRAASARLLRDVAAGQAGTST